MDNITYKGFTGSLEYDEEYKIYHGKLLEIKDLVLYEGHNLKELNNDFREAIDRHIELRKRLDAEKKVLSSGE